MHITSIPSPPLQLDRKCLPQPADSVERAYLRFLEALCGKDRQNPIGGSAATTRVDSPTTALHGAPPAIFPKPGSDRPGFT